MRYEIGSSGNPSGRPTGTKSKKTVVNDAFRLLNNTMNNTSLSIETRILAAGSVIASHNFNNPSSPKNPSIAECGWKFTSYPMMANLYLKRKRMTIEKQITQSKIRAQNNNTILRAQAARLGIGRPLARSVQELIEIEGKNPLIAAQTN